jgi:uncharacterized protein YjiS (DUF1127 family)
MSVSENSNAAPMGAITAFRVVTLFERAADAFAAWRRSRTTAKMLSDLSDKQLADIGLLRGQITEVSDALAGR